MNDVREFLSVLEEKGELVRIKQKVDPRNFELSAVIRQVEDTTGQAVLFENVDGYKVRVMSNLYGSLYRRALALGLEPTPDEIKRYRSDSRGSGAAMAGFTKRSFALTERDRASAIKLREAVERAEQHHGKFKTKTVSSSPVKEIVIQDCVDMLRTIPVVRHCVEDAGPFMTAGVGITKDPYTGTYNMGIFRNQTTHEDHPNRVGIIFSVHSDTYRHLMEYEKQDKAMEIAMVFGSEPAVQTAAAYSAIKGVSELELAGAMKGSPIEMVKCETIDLQVPANAEIVLEGQVVPHLRLPEGPMAEFADYCREETSAKPVFEVKAITMRKDAIYHTIMSGMSAEHTTLAMMVGWGWEKRLLTKLRKEFPTVKAVSFNQGSVLFHIVVSLEKRGEGDDRRLLFYIMSLDEAVFAKYVTIVDDDIDVYNADQVEWARCTRAGRPEDYVIFTGMQTHNLDPMGIVTGPPTNLYLTVSKLGILATWKGKERYKRPGPPPDILDRAKGYIPQ